MSTEQGYILIQALRHAKENVIWAAAVSQRDVWPVKSTAKAAGALFCTHSPALIWRLRKPLSFLIKDRLMATPIRTERWTACLIRNALLVCVCKGNLESGCDYPFTRKIICILMILGWAGLFGRLTNCQMMTRMPGALSVEGSGAWLKHIVLNKYLSELDEFCQQSLLLLR